MSSLRKKASILCNVTTLANEGDLYFWTLTCPDEVHDPREFSYRWNKLRTRLMKEFPQLRGLRVYEYHPGGHGIHMHLVVNCFLPAAKMWRICAAAGFGHIDVRKCDGDAEDVARYLTKYITKAGTEEWHGTRVFGTFGWKGTQTRLRDIEVTTAYGTIWRGLAASLVGFSSALWFAKVEATEAMYADWVRSEAEDPAAYIADRLGYPTTIQTLSVEDMRARADEWAAEIECKQWDREMRRAELDEFWNQRRSEHEARWQEWNERQNQARLAKSREFQL